MHFTYYDFFAGGGMVSFGLGPDWKCLFANDIDPLKAQAYCENHNGGDELKVRDVGQIGTEDLPDIPDLVWGSFPCQDLSLAGKGAGLAGSRSGTFASFWELIVELCHENRRPKIIALENVYGAITSSRGRDLATLFQAFSDLNYQFGALVIDAVHFVPQSRPRLFLIGVDRAIELPSEMTTAAPTLLWHPASLVEAVNLMPKSNAELWRWWQLPEPPQRNITLASIIEEKPSDVQWHTELEMRRLLSLMNDLHASKVTAAKAHGSRVVGTIYKRTRPNKDGTRSQRAEVRFDNVAGCLRTPAGGSSRQTVIDVDGGTVRTRLLSSREAARLMGLPDHYVLPGRYNEAYKLAGDGVVVPVVKYLSENIFEPALKFGKSPSKLEPRALISRDHFKRQVGS